MPPAAVEVEGDVPYQLFARFERSGYAASVRSWIGTAPNQLIEPRQAAHALGTEGVDELAAARDLPAMVCWGSSRVVCRRDRPPYSAASSRHGPASLRAHGKIGCPTTLPICC